MLGLWAHQATGLPWVTDFRDPWSENELQPYLPGYRSVNRRLEARVLAASGRILTVSPPLEEMFVRLCGDGTGSGSSRTVMILKTWPSCRRRIPAVSRSPTPASSAVSVVRMRSSKRSTSSSSAGSIPLSELRVAFAGKDTAKFVPDRPPYEQLGYLKHDELSALRRETDLLLLIHGDSAQSRGNYSGKIFEYLGCNRPTLAITGPDNVAAQLIAGRPARPPDTARTRSQPPCSNYYQGWKSGAFDYAPDWAVIQHFTRRNLTGLLAEQLAQVSNP